MARRHLAFGPLTMTMAVATAIGCAHAPSAPEEQPARVLDVDEVIPLLPAKVKDKQGWAEDVVTAIGLEKKPATPERVCAVLAVIEQESGFQANPAVADLPLIVRRGLEKKLASLGPMAGPALDALLAQRAPDNEHTFGERIDKMRTERDLDRFFRDVTGAFRNELPGPLSLLGKGTVEDLNPVTTAGSMQVKVSFARELGAQSHERLDDDAVRELLYTRGGGVRFGTARLIGYAASYDDVLYRFADYNAGVYASRNAQFQHMLAVLTGRPLVDDGDLLAYDKKGEPTDAHSKTLDAMLAYAEAHGLSASSVERDARKEKTQAFEDTAIWKAVRASWADKTGEQAAYARVPDVELVSPKLAHNRTTQWYASSVKRHYDACRSRT